MICRMARRPSWSGMPRSTSRSKRPKRRSAGSMTDGRLVAATTCRAGAGGVVGGVVGGLVGRLVPRRVGGVVMPRGEAPDGARGVARGAAHWGSGKHKRRVGCRVGCRVGRGMRRRGGSVVHHDARLRAEAVHEREQLRDDAPLDLTLRLLPLGRDGVHLRGRGEEGGGERCGVGGGWGGRRGRGGRKGRDGRRGRGGRCRNQVREGRASTSSMKMMAGAFSLASSKTLRSPASLSPERLLITSGPLSVLK